MAEYDNTNRGGLFKNAQKASPNHADWGGNINVDGVDYFLNAWIKEDKNGAKYFSLSVKQKNKQPGMAAPVAPIALPPRMQQAAHMDLNDEVPF